MEHAEGKLVVEENGYGQGEEAMKLWLTRDKTEAYNKDEMITLWQGRPALKGRDCYTSDTKYGWIARLCRRLFEKKTGIKLAKGEIVELVDIKLKVRKAKRAKEKKQ